jgi:hypothetical protein
MANEVIVYKGRDNITRVWLGIDVSDSTFTSEIRSEPDVESPLLATWDVDFETDGTDGKLVLTLDALTTSQISATAGFMDIKRDDGVLILPVFDKALEVTFRGTVTE